MGNAQAHKVGGPGGPSSVVQSSPTPGKGTLLPTAPEPLAGTEDRSYLADGAACDGPTVGTCALTGSVRSRLVAEFQNRVENAHGAYRTGAALAYTDVELRPDEDVAWYVALALDAGGTVLSGALSRALGRFGHWAAGARNEAYDRLFSGEFVSERALALYAAAAKVPVASLQWVTGTAVGAAKSAIPHLVVPTGGKGAAELLIGVLLRRASALFQHLSEVAPAQSDDVHLLALFEALDPVNGPAEMDYRDEILGRVAEMHSLQIDSIGKDHHQTTAGGSAFEKAAVWISDGTRRRLAMVEHDDPVYRMTKGDQLRVVSGDRNRFIAWVDDPTMQEVAIGLTRARGNGNIGLIDADVARERLEGFQW